MKLQTKMVLALVLLSTAATAAIGLWSYVGTAHRLDYEINRSLADGAHATAARLQRVPGRGGDPRGGSGGGPGIGPDHDEGQKVETQVLDHTGAVIGSATDLTIPVDAGDRAIAAGRASPERRHQVVISGHNFRVLTVPTADRGGAVQVARSLTENERVLDSLRNLVLVAALVVTGLAAASGWIIARQATRRLVRLTGTAEEVAQTGRLDVPVPVGGTDEAGRLGRAFNEMLAALARSRDAQQRLVQDAGHELRTPLTSLHTNVEVLGRHEDLPAATRAQVIADLDAETRELTALVNELVALATDQAGDEPARDVPLGPLVERVAERARRRTGRTVVVTADGSVARGQPEALARAISNLIDNAAKFDDSGQRIEVAVEAGRVSVSDSGPGIAPADADHVFDRFFRSLDARSRPGSGLGLAIVRDVAEAHGGTVFVANRRGTGACIGFDLPIASEAHSVDRNEGSIIEPSPNPHLL